MTDPIGFKLEPALISQAAVLAAALCAAFFVHVTKQQEAAIVTIGAGIAAIITAAMARPVRVSVIAGAASTCAIAAAAFGLHLTTAQIAVSVSVLSAVLGLLIRTHVTPVVTAPAGAGVRRNVA